MTIFRLDDLSLSQMGEGRVRDFPKYAIEIMYADSVSIVVGFGGELARALPFSGRDRKKVK